MKLRHGDLEQIRANPLALQRIASGASGGAYIPYNILLHAVHHYHSKGEDEASAERYLRTAYEKHFVNQNELEVLIRRLKTYIDSYNDQSGRSISTRVRVSLPLIDNVTLSGEIARLDLIPNGGYIGYLLAPRRVKNWHDQIRMPLLQDWVARRFDVPSAEVAVGFYYFDDGHYDQRVFSTTEIDVATQEASRIARLFAGAVANG